MNYHELPLYDHRPPGSNVGTDRGTSRPDRSIDVVGQPLATVMVADEPTGAVVVICPGGGYQKVCVDKEGLDFARVMAGWGVTSLVLTYRTPRGVFTDPPEPLEDVWQALALAAQPQGRWVFDPSKVTLMGFSAGGHLALTALREPGASGVPPYAVLGYPVVDFHPPLVHAGSRDSLLGSSAPEERVERFSALTNLPRLKGAFLVHADDDGAVPVGNSVALAQAWQALNVDCELVRHPTGGHGFGLGPAHGYASALDWTPRLRTWMKARGLAR